MKTVRETCTKCPNKLVNPNWQTKYCPTCKKLVQKEQNAKKNAAISEESRLRRIANGVPDKNPVDPYYLVRGKIGIHGDKLYHG